MSGRGRGRGAKPSIFRDRGLDVSILDSVDGPPRTFPTMENPCIPRPLSVGMKEMVVTQQTYAKWLRASPFYIREAVTKKDDVERYSDRYLPSAKVSRKLDQVIRDLSWYPDELHGVAAKVVKSRGEGGGDSKADILAMVDRVAFEADKKNGAKADGQDEEENPELADEEYDEQEEEENDYVNSYFDNGENDESDGDDGDGATY